MNSINYYALTFTLLLTIILTIMLISSSSSSHHLHPPPPPPGYLSSIEEEKTRLGSTPPSCHNKCNACHPCMAVQVPTTPGHEDRVQLNQRRRPSEFFDPTPSGNYKPLGWKCHCGNHFYNP